MKYAKIKPEMGGKPNKKLGQLLGNELFTEKEVERYGISPDCYNLVEVSKRSVFLMFGARFAVAE